MSAFILIRQNNTLKEQLLENSTSTLDARIDTLPRQYLSAANLYVSINLWVLFFLLKYISVYDSFLSQIP